jgi:hypothetical protein
MTKLLDDEEDVELVEFFSPEETVDKVKTEDFLLGCVGVILANEVCDDPFDAVDVGTG